MKTTVKILLLTFTLLLPLLAKAQVNYVLTTNGAVITASVASSPNASGNIVINTYEGYPVTSIEDFAFYNDYGLTGVTIGTNVTYIGNYTFSGCYYLASVTVMVRQFALLGKCGRVGIVLKSTSGKINLFGCFENEKALMAHAEALTEASFRQIEKHRQAIEIQGMESLPSCSSSRVFQTRTLSISLPRPILALRRFLRWLSTNREPIQQDVQSSAADMAVDS